MTEGEVATLLDDALAAFGEGRLAEAEACCRRVIERAPKEATALHLLGIIAGQTGRTPLAIESLRAVVALDPEAAEALADLCHLLREAGEIAEAIEAGEKALRLDAGKPATLNNLGEAYLAAGRIGDAVAAFERAIARDPGIAALHYNLGVARQIEGRDAEAVAAYQRATTLAPSLAGAHARLGNLLRLHGNLEGALTCYRRAAEAAPDTPVGRLSLAMAQSEEGETEAAEASLRRFLAEQPESAEALGILGDLLTRTRRFDEAVPCFERALALEPRQSATYFSLVNARKMTPAARPLIERMTTLLAVPDLTGRDRANLHYALGKTHDDLGEHEVAMQHFDAANRDEAALQRLAGRTLDRARYVADIDAMMATFTADFFARHAALGSVSGLPILIIGMPRSGTTLVEQIVSSHPEVGGGDELSFWSRRSPALAELQSGRVTPAAVQQLTEDYLALLRRLAPSAQRVTDKMPQNFLRLGPIHLTFPRARIIHCRRDPLDTCLSIYFTPLRALKDFDYDRSDIVFQYEQYRRLMAHWRRVLPPDRFTEIDYEALVADRERETRRLIEFCGLAWDEACLHAERNQRMIRTASKWQARQPVYRSSVERWRRYEPWLGEFRRLAPAAGAASPELARD